MASTDRQLPDAYSSTVTGVVKKAAQSFVYLKVLKKIQEPRTKQIVGQYALDSGFVISSDGYIITSHHVIENTDSVTVIFGDGTEHNATLAGKDPSSDIAVIKVYNEELYTLQFFDSGLLEPGQIAIAIGNPVSTVDNLHKLLNESVIGVKIFLGILRGLRRQITTVIPGEFK